MNPWCNVVVHGITDLASVDSFVSRAVTTGGDTYNIKLYDDIGSLPAYVKIALEVDLICAKLPRILVFYRIRI